MENKKGDVMETGEEQDILMDNLRYWKKVLIHGVKNLINILKPSK